jgi:PAS domain S-box-containing protein
MSEKLTEALAAAMAHSTEPMALSDPHQPDNPIITVNQAFVELTGYAAAETCGRNCRFLQGAQTDPGTPLRIRSALAQGRGCIEWIVNYRKDGTVFWNLLFLSPVFGRDGKLLHYFANQRNITAGPPADLPDYVIGKADMPPSGRRIFDELLLDLLDEPSSAAQSGAALTTLVETARQLNEVTLRLIPAPWSMPES